MTNSMKLLDSQVATLFELADEIFGTDYRPDDATVLHDLVYELWNEAMEEHDYDATRRCHVIRITLIKMQHRANAREWAILKNNIRKGVF